MSESIEHSPVNNEVNPTVNTSGGNEILAKSRLNYMQTLGRLALILPIMSMAPGCDFGKVSAVQLKAAQKNSATALSMWLAQAILDETLTGIADDFKKEQIRTKLKALEKSLTESGSKLADEIRNVQKTLDSKADVSGVRMIVQQVLSEMEAQSAAIDKDVDAATLRLKRDEDLFGYVPTVPPSPLLQRGADEESIAHPKFIEWTKLLCRSETHRAEMEDLSRIYKPNAPEMEESIAQWEELKKESAELHISVEMQLVKKLTERVHLLETLRATHPSIKQFDAEIASLAWLAVITRPAKSGRYEGSLTVSPDLVGPEASDILAAFKLAGETEESIVPLYRQLIDVMPATALEIFSRSKNDWSGETGIYLQNFKIFINQYKQYAAKANREVKNVQMIDSDLKHLLKTHSPLYLDVKVLNQSKTKTLLKLKELHESGDSLLNNAIHLYVQNLQEYRPSHPQMQEYNRTVLGPLKETVEHLSCFDWNNSESKEETWQKFQHLDLICAVKFGILRTKERYLGEAYPENGSNWEDVSESDKHLFATTFKSGQIYGKINRKAGIAYLSQSTSGEIKIFDIHKSQVIRTIGGYENVSRLIISDTGDYVEPKGYEKMWDLKPFTAYEPKAEIKEEATEEKKE